MTETVTLQQSVSLVGFSREDVITRKTTILGQYDEFEVHLVEETRQTANAPGPVTICLKCTVYPNGMTVCTPIDCKKPSSTLASAT